MVVTDLVPAVIVFDGLAGLRGRDTAAIHRRQRISFGHFANEQLNCGRESISRAEHSK